MKECFRSLKLSHRQKNSCNPSSFPTPILNLASFSQVVIIQHNYLKKKILMPELRKDPVLGRWVIISTERAKRPNDFKKVNDGPQEGECPFCEQKEGNTPSELFAIRRAHPQSNAPGWDIRVVPSISPFLKLDNELWKKGVGLYDLMGATGSHEVVIETPQHIANMADLETTQIEKVLTAYAERIKTLEQDKRIKYVLIFKNYGWKAGGGRVRHARSQIIATPVVLKRVKEELAGAKSYFEYHERCVFCDLVKQELTEQKRVILEVDGIVAVAPFAPRFPFEVWVMPKRHSADFQHINPEESRSLAVVLKEILSRLKKLLGDPPYNYVIHSAPFRRERKGYWTTIEEDYHWHLEIIPRLTLVAGFEWGSGFYICPVPPEEAAKFLKNPEVVS